MLPNPIIVNMVGHWLASASHLAGYLQNLPLGQTGFINLKAHTKHDKCTGNFLMNNAHQTEVKFLSENFMQIPSF